MQKYSECFERIPSKIIKILAKLIFAKKYNLLCKVLK